MEVKNSGFTDWSQSTLVIPPRLRMVVNEHPISGIRYLDINSITIDGMNLGDKFADFLLDGDIPIRIIILINYIYGIHLREHISLREYLSNNSPKITSPYFEVIILHPISFDKCLGGRLLFLFSSKLIDPIIDLITLLYHEIYLRDLNEFT